MLPVQTSVLPPTRRFPLLPVAACGVALALLTLSLLATERFYLYTIVGVLGALCLGPGVVMWRRGTLDFFEPIHVVGLIYFAYFGLGAIWTVNDPSRVAYDIHVVPYIPTAALYCTLGYAALLLGYYAPWEGRVGPRRFEWMPRGVILISVIGGLGLVGNLSNWASVAAQQMRTAIPLPMSAIGQLSPLFYFAWALAWLLFLSGRATRGQRWLLFGFLLPAAFIVGRTYLGSKSTTMILAVLPLAAFWYAKRRLPWKSLVVLLLILIFIVFPFYNRYRSFDWSVESSERLSMTVETMNRWDTGTYLDWSIGTFKKRLALINSTAVIIRDVGRWEPYAYGKTVFMPFLIYLTPRVLWPDKPLNRIGIEFAETFRMLHPLDNLTSVAATVPGELYWNFGVPGILVGMFAWGVLMRALFRRFGETPSLDPVRRAVYLVLLVQFAHFGGALAANLVRVVRVLIMLLVMFWIARRFDLLQNRDAPTP